MLFIHTLDSEGGYTVYILLFFSIFMGFSLFFLSFHVKFFRKKLKLYSVLFTFLSTALFINILYENQHIWAQRKEPEWVAEQHYSPAHSVPAISNYNPLESIDNLQLKEEIRLTVPLIEQLPELPRGCEVTSLTMLLNYNGYQVDKMTLAKEIKKDKTPYQVKDGKIYFGNPYDGFVGSMYSFSEPGLGVYHGPLVDLAKKYVKDHNVVDLTGKSFYEVLSALNQNQPVVVIINAKYKKLPKSSFTTWHTPSGKIDITMSEHSVLITGYDKDYIYFNDPLNRKTKAPFDDFVAAWEQMGKQAITLEKKPLNEVFAL
jgi:uncharacterized protein YvpB